MSNPENLFVRYFGGAAIEVARMGDAAAAVKFVVSGTAMESGTIDFIYIAGVHRVAVAVGDVPKDVAAGLAAAITAFSVKQRCAFCEHPRSRHTMPYTDRGICFGDCAGSCSRRCAGFQEPAASPPDEDNRCAVCGSGLMCLVCGGLEDSS